MRAHVFNATERSGWVSEDGATEHIAANCDCVAFANIGLMDSAWLGQNYEEHMQAITTQTRDLLVQHACLGILFCECGSWQKGYKGTAKERFEEAVTAGFRQAGATEHGPPQILWPD